MRCPEKNLDYFLIFHFDLFKIETSPEILFQRGYKGLIDMVHLFISKASFCWIKPVRPH